MAAVVRIKNNRFVKVDLQNKNARFFSFGQVDKPGLLDGYIKGVVHTAYPVFESNYYGKLRKMIIEETKDDDDGDDNEEHHRFSLFTRGEVAKKCSEIKEGDILLLEMPFFELSHPKKAALQIIGDKKCSDICIWIVSKKSRLLVGLEKEDDDSDFESVDNAADSGETRNQDGDQDSVTDASNSDSERAASPAKQTSSSSNRMSARVKRNVLKSSLRHAKNSASGEENTSRKSLTPKKNEKQKSPRITSASASSNEDMPKQSPRIPRDVTSRENDSFPESKRVTRSTSAKRGNISNLSLSNTRSTSLKESNAIKNSSRKIKKKNVDNFDAGQRKDKMSFSSSQEDGHQTRSLSRKSSMEKSDSSPPTKRKKKFRLGPKGSSSSPNESPEIRNVVALDVQPKKAPRKENQLRLQVIIPKIDGSRVTVTPPRHLCKVPDSFNSPKSTTSAVTEEEVSQENDEDEIQELEINSQVSTPSGTFSSKRRKYIGQEDSSPGTPNKKLPPKANKAVTATSTRTSIKKSSASVCSSTDRNENVTNCRNSNQPNDAESGVITFVDDNVLLENSSDSQTSSHSANKRAKVVKDTAKPQETRDSNTAVLQSSTSEPSASVTSSNVPSHAGSNSNTVHLSYSLPATYTKISDVKLNTMCNLYGVAKFFKPPWKSRGTDMCSVVILADPSSDEPLECVMFKDLVLLPQVRRVGDIVRLHRMNIKKYKDKLQAVSTRGFSALVFDHNVSIPVTKESARVTTGSFSFDEAEKIVVQTLKEWRISRPDLFEEAKFLTMSEVEPDIYFDIVCQVKGISKHTNIDCVVLTVTDGTIPHHEIKSCEDDDSYQVTLATDYQSPTPTSDVFLYGEHASMVMNLDVKAGTIVLLHNVHSIVTQGGPGASLLDVLEPTLELCVHRGSEYGRGLSILSPDSKDTQDLLQRLKQQTIASSPKK